MPRGRPKKYATAEEAAAGRLARNRESYQRRQQSKKEEEETPSQSILQFTPLFQPTTTTIASSSKDVPAPAPLVATKEGVENNTGKDVSRLQEALGGLNLQSQVNKDDEEAAAILQELQQSEGVYIYPYYIQVCSYFSHRRPAYYPVYSNNSECQRQRPAHSSSSNNSEC